MFPTATCCCCCCVAVPNHLRLRASILRFPPPGLPDKITWVEKFVEVARPTTEAAKAEHER